MKITKNQIIYTAGAFLVSYGVKAGLKYGYKKIYGKKLPDNPEKSGIDATQAIIWTVGISALGGLAKLLYRKNMYSLKES
ncbi:hypothetical protein OO013_04255 [Mangrovivirga sp. M17]|uniref:DUF4235 domain-containing protein n=1 Tax=Mangrovivirga halotolerans TaxID=2993936 RepID=A0ABT3RP72_9BACT|nr:hypothetical protein [Mangrovivirga halotolerans]MCX2743062.1 hypothetical protein [Mangrovivirga halotolerans]